MKKWLLGINLSICILASSYSLSQTLLPPNEEKTVGQKLPNVHFFDSTGKKFNLYDLAGSPLLINPIFTRCQITCPEMTKNIRDVIIDLKNNGENFHILSLSFDIKDQIQDLALFKTEKQLPSFWKVVGAEKKELFQFLNAIDFKFISQEDGGFVHPNLVLVVTPDLKLSKYIYGTEFKRKTLQKALIQARHPVKASSFLTSFLFLFSVLGFILSFGIVTFFIFNKN